MTNEEAIKVLSALWAYKAPQYSEKEIREALDLAIKALEERPKYSVSYLHQDSITNAPAVESRIEYGTDGQPYRLFISGEITEEQAIDKLHETGWMVEHDKEMTERPTGHWEKTGPNMYHCSHCGAVDSIGFANFCWLCGADMRGSAKMPSNGKKEKTLTEAFLEDINTDEVNYNELCYRTGHHMTMCDCELCDHRHECSGYEGDAE